MNLIGLTGGIGSGKSTVADIFKTLGVPVYESDQRAKYLMNHNEDLKKRIKALLGAKAYLKEGEINRTWIANQVFTDRDLLIQLNAIVHPAVYEDLKDWAAHPQQLLAPYLIQESAILFEENLTSRLKGIILIVASEETRIERVMERDKTSREEVLKRISHQWPDEKKVPLSDYVIYNEGTKSLIAQVRDIDVIIRSSLDKPL
jgi:dephospho-CoA kinase